MKAIVQNAYGSTEVFKLKEVAMPEVKDTDVLVRVYATAANAGDYFSMKGSPWLARMSVGFPKPKDYIPGWDFAGQVELVGNDVKQFQPGDEVYGASAHTFAEYVSADADALALKPANLTFEQAAAVPTAALTALQGLRDKGQVQKSQKVLINGASGGVGTFSVQIARYYGAEVTGVCSTKKVEMIRSIGADHVVDYTKEDFTIGGPRYDLILDNVASRSFSDLRRALTPQGLIIPNSGHSGMSYVIQAYALSAFTRQLISPWMTSVNNTDLVFLKDLIEAGELKPVVDRMYPLSQAPEAIGYLGDEHPYGKVIINVVQNDVKGG
jgi:NADPH:quinone reductase-like Zn-dependent oxidoreductase